MPTDPDLDSHWSFMTPIILNFFPIDNPKIIFVHQNKLKLAWNDEKSGKLRSVPGSRFLRMYALWFVYEQLVWDQRNHPVLERLAATVPLSIAPPLSGLK